MATIKFLIDTIAPSFGRTDEAHDYFQLQYKLLEKGHVMQYYFASSGEIASTIKTLDHLTNFIETFKFLPSEEILNRL
jgi:hypothetical protein